LSNIFGKRNCLAASALHLFPVFKIFKEPGGAIAKPAKHYDLLIK